MTYDKNIQGLDDLASLVGDEKQVLTTSCQECVFAIKEDKKEGWKQTGCSLGRVETYKKRGIEITEANIGDDEFYGLHTWCNAYREEPWAIAHEGEDLSLVFKKESDPKVGFVIIVRDSLNGLEKTINSTLSQEDFKAKHLLILNSGIVNYLDVIDETNSILSDKDVSYKIQDTIKGLSDEELIDEAFKNAKNGFYSVFECGEKIPSDLIKTLHEAINIKLMSVGVVRGHDGINGLTVQCLLHKFLYGNKGASIEKKLKEGEEYDGTDPENSLIKTWDELR